MLPKFGGRCCVKFLDRRNNIFLGFYSLISQKDVYEDETDLEVCHSEPLTMHKIDLKAKHGCLRFRLQYMPEKETLSVTILDAQDLPAMDPDGKSDPYVEVSNT